ncbi:hypothetical protein MPL3356_540015 [Mesorhizobium plurifarium]|uniref:Uncharacterized protein n=1 Tax=Mesorhizobium plurifarium TaxID=69974 RepID=A0A090G3W1_MESPL|nr:hypothetical protein MPL3356_540015 [Mesorhizobium plurifarium]CDX56072.1 hypothetical protein MPL3365_230016 [Mesorhizobium plurifarium]
MGTRRSSVQLPTSPSQLISVSDALPAIFWRLHRGIARQSQTFVAIQGFVRDVRDVAEFWGQLQWPARWCRFCPNALRKAIVTRSTPRKDTADRA